MCCGGGILWFMGPPRGIKPPVEVAAPKVTGDTEIDRALADLGADFPAWQRATDKLSGMQPNQHRAVVAQKLAAQADSPDRSKRQAVLKALAVWATSSEVPVLIKALDDDLARHDVLNAIGKLKDERTLAPVMRCFVDPHSRGPAAKALRDMGPMAEKEVLAVLERKDPDFLFQDAVDVLRDIGTQQSVPALQALAKKDGRLAQKAQAALNAIAARAK
jgi:hypothetical protein